MSKRIITIVAYILLLSAGYAQSVQWTQSAHPGGLQVNGVAFSPSGQRVISGTNCHPSKVRQYNIANGAITWDYTVDTAFYCLMGVGFSSNGNYCGAVEEMGNVLVFSTLPATPVLVDTIVMGTMYAFSIDFAPNSYKMVLGGSNGKLQTYQITGGVQDLNVSAHASWVTAVNYSPDNKRIASGGSDAKVKLWDTTGTLLHTLSSHTDDITSIRFSKDNARLFSASLDDKIKVWNVATGTLLQTISPSVADVMGIDISADNNHLVAVSADKGVRIYNTNTYQLEASFGVTGAGSPLCVAWSQTDATRIAVGYSNGTVVLYNVGNALSLLPSANKVNSVEVSPNPFTDRIMIQNSSLNISTVEVHDEQGKLLLRQTTDKNQQILLIETDSDWQKGVYFMSCITDKGEVYVKKVIR